MFYWLNHMNIQKKQKIALVLSGGGVKAAAYHIGVCLALKELGFEFKGETATNTKSHQEIKLYVGSSAGAFISATLASGRPIESLIAAFQVGIANNPNYQPTKNDKLKPIGYRHIFNLNGRRLLKFIPETIMDKSIITGGVEAFLKSGFKLNGLFNTKGIERYMRKYLLKENDFAKLNAELYIIATQLNHSRKTIFGAFKESTEDDSVRKIGYSKISEAVAASTALPPVFAPYPIKRPNGKELYHYDGEIRDTLSTHVASDHGADLVISSFSMQPYHYVPKIGSLHEYGMPAILNQALYQVLEQKVARHIQYQGQKKNVYDALKKICNDENLSTKVKDKILLAVKEELNHNENVDWIYISPMEKNFEMFFADHFSLNPEILEKIVKIGFKSAIMSMKRVGIV